MTSNEARIQLQRLVDWAHEKIKGGNEPPWAWYQYMKLIETATAILQSMALTTTVDSRRAAKRLGNNLRLVDGEPPPNNVPPDPPEGPIRLPM